MRLSLFLAVLIYIILTFFLAGNYFNWYWNLWWLDDLTHFLGGLWLAAFFVYLTQRANFPAVIGDKFWVQLILGLGFVALIGVLWEFHEFVGDWYLQKPILQAGGVKDTLGDLLQDLLGGLTFFILNRLSRCWKILIN